MTVCNMSIEAGAKAGLIAPDDVTFAYLEGRPHAPRAPPGTRRSTTGAPCPPTTGPPSTRRSPRRRRHRPPRLLGHQPRPGRPHRRRVPTPTPSPRPPSARPPRRALEYMGLTAGTPMREVAVDTVFIGSCTNSRIEDLRAAAAVADGRTVGRRAHAGRARLLRGEGPGRGRGPRPVLTAAGFDWREPGCSMCLAMNPDKLAPGERSASTSQPQLRGPPGPGRAHPPRLPRRRRRHRHRRPLRHPRPDLEEHSDMEPVRIVQGTAVPLDRSDVDTDQIIPGDWLKRVERTGFGNGLFSEWRDDRELRAQRRALRRRHHPRRPGPTSAPARPRARRVGDHGLRLRGRRLPPLRRHLPQQLHQERPGARARSIAEVGEPLLAAVEADPTLEITIDVERRTLSAPAIGIEATSRSTTPPASGSSRASTTSASPCATPAPSTPSRTGAPAWLPAVPSGSAGPASGAGPALGRRRAGVLAYSGWQHDRTTGLRACRWSRRLSTSACIRAGPGGPAQARRQDLRRGGEPALVGHGPSCSVARRPRHDARRSSAAGVEDGVVARLGHGARPRRSTISEAADHRGQRRRPAARERLGRSAMPVLVRIILGPARWARPCHRPAPDAAASGGTAAHGHLSSRALRPPPGSPAPGSVRLARILAAGVAADAGLSIDDTEDLRSP